ncbi:hypothetical protein B0H12DRAFT_429845 [Mycena haematopus]|nr:hypothetical protein B0H12DRAFT_429845 [Mycena haematopus]
MVGPSRSALLCPQGTHPQHTNVAVGWCARVWSSFGSESPFVSSFRIPDPMFTATNATFFFFGFKKAWISAIILYNRGLVVQPRPLPRMALYFDTRYKGKGCEIVVLPGRLGKETANGFHQNGTAPPRLPFQRLSWNMISIQSLPMTHSNFRLSNGTV